MSTLDAGIISIIDNMYLLLFVGDLAPQPLWKGTQVGDSGVHIYFCRPRISVWHELRVWCCQRLLTLHPLQEHLSPHEQEEGPVQVHFDPQEQPIVIVRLIVWVID